MDFYIFVFVKKKHLVKFNKYYIIIIIILYNIICLEKLELWVLDTQEYLHVV